MTKLSLDGKTIKRNVFCLLPSQDIVFRMGDIGSDRYTVLPFILKIFFTLIGKTIYHTCRDSHLKLLFYNINDKITERNAIIGRNPEKIKWTILTFLPYYSKQMHENFIVYLSKFYFLFYEL